MEVLRRRVHVPERDRVNEVQVVVEDLGKRSLVTVAGVPGEELEVRVIHVQKSYRRRGRESDKEYFTERAGPRFGRA